MPYVVKFTKISLRLLEPLMETLAFDCQLSRPFVKLPVIYWEDNSLLNVSFNLIMELLIYDNMKK